MTYQAEHIKEGSRCIFAKLFNIFTFISRCDNRSIDRQL